MPENAGRLSPITSSSGQHEGETDNFVEYYVKADKAESEYVTPENNVHKGENKICGTCKFYLPAEDACAVVNGGVEREAYCKLYVEGGEKMTDKGLDVDQSITTDNAYEADTNTTEPDPKSELAMQKSFDPAEWSNLREKIREFAKAAAVGGPTYDKPAKQEGVGTYSTTANSTVDAPAPGSTTEPEAVHKAAGCSCDCEHCQKCAGMGVAKDSHCDCCADCGPSCSGDCCDNCNSVSKSDANDEELEKVAKPEAEESESDEPDDDEDDLEKKEFPVKKSVWSNMFLPVD